MNVFLKKAADSLTLWVGDGPWRSKSVLAALLAVVVGVGFWCSDLKNSSTPGNTETAVTNAPSSTTPGSASAPTSPRPNGTKPIPFYARLGLSYAAGYCIGWFFRKLTRLIIIVTALVVALVAYGKLAGCDMTGAQERAKRGGAWVQRETSTVEKYLEGLLPSAVAGGVGTVLGFRRRGQAVPRKQTNEVGN